ncbi:D-alanine--D-alanine ligase [Glaciecola sp. KUL10]|uniref:D-alanine--D-alanine ligase n=1 Tax=Glaciecola sp. (strain KUL10) TaxID=2161813 RepID=UPI000D783583|nr:D-alanine--D-alanine ligase [Glaciecola sp. KUL10]GBL05624.1 D-alanine--D-alanine ligase [Glaciecola sp. KUL10]
MKHIQAGDFGKVAVLYGGDSQEREVSMASGKAVHQGLINSGIDAHLFDPSTRPLEDLVTDNYARAFIVLHGRGGEDGTIQGALQHLKLPYTGSNVQGSAIAMDKLVSKQIWQALGLPTAKYRVVDAQDVEKTDYQKVLDDLNGIVMVKPIKEGSSIGMAKVNNADELKSAVQTALGFDNQVLIEAYISGLEYTVSILDGEALPSIRMSTPHTFYDYDAKYKDSTTEYFCPSGLPASIEEQLSKLAIKAFRALKGSGWGRVDVMQDAKGDFYLLESNTVPGMTKTSLVPKAAKQAGISFEELVWRILLPTI